MAERIPPKPSSALLPSESTALEHIANAARENQLAEEYMTRGLEHAIAAGQELIAAKARLRHGEFVSMLEANWPRSVRHAQYLMKLARNAKRVSLLPPDMPLRQAIAAVSSAIPPEEAAPEGELSEREKALWMLLGEQLHSYHGPLATQLGVGDVTIVLDTLLTAKTKYGDVMTARVIRGQMLMWLNELLTKPGRRTRAGKWSRSRGDSIVCKCGRCCSMWLCPKCTNESEQAS